jgi:ribonuclease HI
VTTPRFAGAARGNPGDTGCGAAIFDEYGALVKEFSRYLGRATNNVAEYESLLMDLEAMLQLGIKILSFRAIRSCLCAS